MSLSCPCCIYTPLRPDILFLHHSYGYISKYVYHVFVQYACQWVKNNVLVYIVYSLLLNAIRRSLSSIPLVPLCSSNIYLCGVLSVFHVLNSSLYPGCNYSIGLRKIGWLYSTDIRRSCRYYSRDAVSSVVYFEKHFFDFGLLGTNCLYSCSWYLSSYTELSLWVTLSFR